MNILSVAYPLFPASADAAGGAEQILWLLERGLVASGHQSIVVCATGSRVSGALVETPAVIDKITDTVRRDAQRIHLQRIEWALERFRIDLVHFHGLDFSAYVPAIRIPKLATLHLPLAWYPQSIFDIAGVRFCCVSESQARTAPKRMKLPVVPNGVDVCRYRADMPRSSFLLWLGRICPEKGTDIALRVAHRFDLPLIVAGPVHPFASHEQYFCEKVQPLLDQRRQYVGPIGIEQKVELLAQARCVLISSLAAETGSLVAMEAIASGAAAIAFRSGALPEIIENGVTGFIVDSEEAMTAAVSRADEISPEKCRKEALRRFDAARMVRDYLDLYQDLLASE
jgi:glycosyltransferase involved in cell wall biosynthesis